MPPRFSIITPTWNRADGRLQRCIASVQAQTFTDFEHIIVDDGSTDDTAAVVGAVKDPRVRYVYIEHGGRVQARNAGMRRAFESGATWQVWLDSDDALDLMYLATVDYHAAKVEPTARLWVVGAAYHGMIKEDGKHIVPKWTKIRKAWMPPVNSDGVHGEHFRSGKIGTGQFIYHRECYEKIGPLPNWRNHVDIANGVDEWLEYNTGYSAKSRWVGNPHGDDYCYFRKLTMFYRVHLVQAALYVQYVR